jgi:hypothetical protein
MKVSEVVQQLAAHDQSAELGAEHLGFLKAANLSFPFWQGIVCTGLEATRPLFHLSGEESAAYDVVKGIFCAGKGVTT